MALALAGCSGTTGKPKTSAAVTPKTKPHEGGTVTFALLPATIPNYILPFYPFADDLVVDIDDFQYLMFRPLYWFGRGAQPVFNDNLSLAQAPVWSDEGKTVTITLKKYKWSDGEAVNATDVAFWEHLVTAEKANFGGYVPGQYPDNVVGTKVVGPSTVQFHLNRAYNHQWFLDDELSQITPFPAAWDVTSTGAKPGSGGCATAVAKCKAVYTFLTNQAKDSHSYATNPLWQVVDGPWRLKDYNTTGYSVFVPNRSYSGPIKPHLSKFIEEPFTTDAAEYSAVRSGQLDYGYVPIEDASQRGLVKSEGYRFAPWPGWRIGYIYINYHNPKVGPLFHQTYIRQAMEELDNQVGQVKAFYKGFAAPGCGPVPIQPANPYVDSYEKSCPHGYDPGKAVAALKAHGWHVVPQGVSTCARPGPGAGKCGPGVAKGAKLEFDLESVSGDQPVDQSMENMKTTMEKAGILVNLSTGPFNSMAGELVPCKPSQSACSWEMLNFGFGIDYSPYPSGGNVFATGALGNPSGYSNRTDDANIVATQDSNEPSAMSRYENFLSDQVPVLWTPESDNQLSVIRSNLYGALPQSPLAVFTPEAWYYR